MIELNGIQYEILMYVEKKHTPTKVDKLINTMIAAAIAKAFLDCYRDKNDLL